MTLRKTHKTWHKSKETAEKLKLIINDKFSNDNLYEIFVNSILEATDAEQELIVL